MTQDYNNILLDYLTGKLEITQNSNVPIFNQQEETLANNIYKNIESYLQENENATSILPLGKVYNEEYKNYVIYGRYINNNQQSYGFIYIVDDKLDEIEMITEFASGTKLFPIVALNQAEDGNFYGLSFDDNSVSKVLLFNNIIASGLLDGEYKAILRNDYIIPYNYSLTSYRQNRIIKSSESATYYIIMNDSSGSSTITKIIKFVINVGSTNEWSEYSTTKLFQAQFGINLSKNGNNEIFKIYGLDSISQKYYYEYTLENNVLTQSYSLEIPINFSAFSSAVYIINNERYLLIGGNPNENNFMTLYAINNNSLIKIYELEYYTAEVEGETAIYYSYIQLYEINNGVFGIIEYRRENDNVISLCYINDANINVYEVFASGKNPIGGFLYDYNDFYYINNYNLVSFYIPYYSTSLNNTKKLTFDYNLINYNGIEYVDINSLVPQKARLYDENDNMIFARNLYNKTTNMNTTVSTVNIPNTLLNNQNINIQKLIGKTNYELISNSTLITKNIYENVNINFFNTLRMINNNDVNNPIFNLNGSIRINESVSQNNDYDNAKATKLHIIYNDNTDTYRQISEGQITINNGIATYELVVYSPTNNIQRIEIVSQDESTIYQTITGTFESNKYYKIVQEVTIGE